MGKALDMFLGNLRPNESKEGRGGSLKGEVEALAIAMDYAKIGMLRSEHQFGKHG